MWYAVDPFMLRVILRLRRQARIRSDRERLVNHGED